MASRILFLSAHPGDAHRLSQMLQSVPLALDHAESLRQARNQLQLKEYDVLLTEAVLPDGSWLDALRLAREGPRDPVLIVTDPQADARFWSQALNLGAYDLLAQPFYEPEVRRILSNACSRQQPRPQYRQPSTAAA
jgi:DNA-binding NtrC family response regulator